MLRKKCNIYIVVLICALSACGQLLVCGCNKKEKLYEKYPGLLINTGTGTGTVTGVGSWLPTSTADNCPSPRWDHTAVWTGSKMIVWGGMDDNGKRLNTGGIYDPETDSWLQVSTGIDCPSPRSLHTAVWAGSKMVIWGGLFQDNGNSIILGNGSVYDPETNSWFATSINGDCPSPRFSHIAVSTGSQMIIWGGVGNQSQFNDGAVFDPNLNTWTKINNGNECPSARYVHTGVWTGTDMIIWGGIAGGSSTHTGAVYNPGNDSWSSTSESNGPRLRWGHTAVWTGNEMIIWGVDVIAPGVKTPGGVYDPVLNIWKATSTLGACPTDRSCHTAVSIGGKMIVWGGSSIGGPYEEVGSGGVYNPEDDRWEPTSMDGDCPVKRSYHTAISTGSTMIIWGGAGGTENISTNTGGIFTP
ncbi:MAG: hypothetical protein E3J72_21665 [Planctomycetota bacterium]|nr:MAG: hypothetical protein E3J72_21665 [Planctomycetota bacterium]